MMAHVYHHRLTEGDSRTYEVPFFKCLASSTHHRQSNHKPIHTHFPSVKQASIVIIRILSVLYICIFASTIYNSNPYLTTLFVFSASLP